MSESRVTEIEKELEELSDRKNQLINELKKFQKTPSQKIYGTPLTGYDTQTYEGRIAIFLKLFRARSDLYSHYWRNTKTGKEGFSVVCLNEWRNNICFKPKIKCRDCYHQSFRPFDKSTAEDHLLGKQIIGSHALRADGTCVFFMADFGGKNWKKDVLFFKNTANDIGVDCAIERSRSGNGAHAWIFFSHHIPALKARQLGSLILGLSLANNP
ncbi:MAG: hypothetical protein OXB84_04350, partial [Halobacteriovoraceae bacterium]|nr:hypothetical protein [Halobacteriovoraceae bacterium]